MNEIAQHNFPVLPYLHSGEHEGGELLQVLKKEFDSQILIDRGGEKSAPEQRHSANPVDALKTGHGQLGLLIYVPSYTSRGW